MKIHHIGYLVHDINASLIKMNELGFTKMSEIECDEDRDIDIVFIENSGFVVELVQPKSEKSVVWKQLERIGCSPYHICYVADNNMEDSIKELKASGGYRVILPPAISKPLDNKRVAFLFSLELGIVELIEK